MKAYTKPNVRFWTTANSRLAKVTLQPGQRLHWEVDRSSQRGYHLIVDFEYFENKVWKRESLIRRENGRRHISHWLGSATVNEINGAVDRRYGDLLFRTEDRLFAVI